MKGDLFVQSWAKVRRVRRGSLSSELLMCGGGVREYCENITVQQIVKCKLLSPTSIFADNYRYVCNKYNIAHFDWYRDMPFITNMICTEYTNH